MLAGNAPGSAALEAAIAGPALLFEEDRLIALAGADLSAEIDGMRVPMCRPVAVRKGSVLRFGRPVSGCRVYIAVAGGIDVPEVMNSRSTYMKAGIGGFRGRLLQKGLYGLIILPLLIPAITVSFGRGVWWPYRG
ncbi:hypothetical protein [Bhargavaea cecembensis]|uniref:hypothetical protein n=1 Tax=Bhargavaea cecembensis TaxID=394098 RepID=UPI003F8D739D